MMNLIDRYIYAVAEYLPKAVREDVSIELRANIVDMLPENASEEQIREVLEKLGNPRKLADEYNPAKRYLIGPGLYEKYLSILKLVIAIVVPVMTVLIIFGWLVDPQTTGDYTQNLVDFFIDVFGSLVQILLNCFFWVTLVFTIIERSGAYDKNKEWSLADLPTFSESDKSKIPKNEPILSILFTVLFTGLLFFQPQLIAIYLSDGNGFTNAIPLLETERLQLYLIWILLLALFQLGLAIWKLILKNWNTKLAIANAVTNAAGCILVPVMLFDNALFSSIFEFKIAEITNISLSELASIWSVLRLSIVIVCIAISVWDSISGFRKVNK